VLVGVPWLALFVARAWSQIGRVTIYSSGDDWLMYQVAAYRVSLNGYWAQGGSAALNGRVLDGFASPGGYVVLDRTWRNGDSVAVKLPMSIHLHPMPDDPTLSAVMYGSLVLAGRLGTEGLTPEVLRAEPTKPRTVPEYKGEPRPALEIRAQDIRRGSELEFRAGNMTLVPFHTIFDERYAIYWRLV